MNYQKLYYAIINNAAKRENLSYVESHHIIPKFLGGSDEKSNRVLLTPREHFICHLLLSKFVPDNKKYAAVKSIYMMLSWSYSNENRISILAGMSKKIIRIKHPTMPDEIKEKLSNATKLQFHDIEKRERHLAGVRARYEKQEEIDKLSKSQSKRFENDNEKQKISDSLKQYFKENGCKNKGRSYSHLSKEERKRIFGRSSSRKKGIPRSPETIAKIKAALAVTFANRRAEKEKSISNQNPDAEKGEVKYALRLPMELCG